MKYWQLTLSYCIETTSFRIPPLHAVYLTYHQSIEFLPIWMDALGSSLCLTISNCETLSQILMEVEWLIKLVDFQFGWEFLSIATFFTSHFSTHSCIRFPNAFFIESFPQIRFEGKWLQNRLRADEKWVEITFGGQYPGTPTWRFLQSPL